VALFPLYPDFKCVNLCEINSLTMLIKLSMESEQGGEINLDGGKGCGWSKMEIWVFDCWRDVRGKCIRVQGRKQSEYSTIKLQLYFFEVLEELKDKLGRFADHLA
jgi:hypothetical protein